MRLRPSIAGGRCMLAALTFAAVSVGLTTAAVGAERVVLGEYFNATW